MPNRRNETADDLVANRFAQLRMGDGEVAAPLEPMIDDPRGLALDVEQEAGFFAAEFLIELDQDVAERKVEHARYDQHRCGQRNASRIVHCRQAREHIAHGRRVAVGVIEADAGNGPQQRIE